MSYVCRHGNSPFKYLHTYMQDMDEQVHLLTDEKQKLETEQWKKQCKVKVRILITVSVLCVCTCLEKF